MNNPHKLPAGALRPMPNHRPGNRRRIERTELSLLGRMQTLHGTRTVQLHDVSSWGAMVRGAPPTASKGSEAILKCHELDVFATIQWISGETCGIRFDTPIRDAAINALQTMSAQLSRNGGSGAHT